MIQAVLFRNKESVGHKKFRSRWKPKWDPVWRAMLSSFSLVHLSACKAYRCSDNAVTKKSTYLLFCSLLWNSILSHRISSSVCCHCGFYHIPQHPQEIAEVLPCTLRIQEVQFQTAQILSAVRKQHGPIHAPSIQWYTYPAGIYGVSDDIWKRYIHAFDLWRFNGRMVMPHQIAGVPFVQA